MKTPNRIITLSALALMATAAMVVMGAPALVGAAMAIAFGMAVPASQLAQDSHAMNITHTDLEWGDGDDNMGGLRTKAYWCMHSEVATHAEPMARADASSYADLATIGTDHTFVSGKGWKSIYTTEDTGMVESTMQGEKDGKSWINKIKLHFPGGRAQILGFLRYIGNAGMYFVGVDAEGAKRLVGSRHYPAKLEASTITTTETAAGRKGATIEAQCSSPYPAPIVTATLSLENSSESV